MWVSARLQILCNETPKLPGCCYQNTMEFTKYDHVTIKPCMLTKFYFTQNQN